MGYFRKKWEEESKNIMNTSNNKIEIYVVITI